MATLLGGTGPWAGANMACQLASATLAEIAARLGGTLPPVVDVIVTVNKPSLSLGGAIPVVLYQVDAEASGAVGVQRLSQTVANGTQIRLKNIVIDPAMGGVVLTTSTPSAVEMLGGSLFGSGGNGCEGGATLDFALPGMPPGVTGGVNTKSAADVIADAAAAGVTGAPAIATGGFVLIVIVILVLVAFQFSAAKKMRGG